MYAWCSGGAVQPRAAAFFLAYNLTAFGLQPVVGYLCDARRGKASGVVGVFGCLLIAAVALFAPAHAVSVALVGLGNACFHAAGGADTLRRSGGRAAPGGVFVSSGALGVALGYLAGVGGLPRALPVALLLFCAAAQCAFCLKAAARGAKGGAGFTVVRPGISAAAVLFLASVSIAVRSYAGSIVPMEWRTQAALFMLPAAAAFFGKACGGFAADAAGGRAVGVYCLLASVPLVVLAHANPWLCALGIALFNMNMPVTLSAVATALPRNPGLAFGVTTIALLCGNVPLFLFAVSYPVAVFAALTTLSAVCLSLIVGGFDRAKLHRLR
uniref:Membrane efflux protein (Fosmidomycin resistance) n=1 Tax=uncultured bacterium contig00006 TaxID=1181498 RepID=A0A806KK84_9BACT|nr:membrane efflux protein (fosmidomycin resistance) [uncultured bacterium contig00006]